MQRKAGLLLQLGRQLTRRCGLTLHEADHCYAGECQRREPATVIMDLRVFDNSAAAAYALVESAGKVIFRKFAINEFKYLWVGK
jgi:hypothetical protein